MKLRSYTKREQVLAGFFALAALFPIATGTFDGAALAGRVSQGEIERAFDDKDEQSRLRRMRWSIIRDCAQREAAGDADSCPDPNDYDALRTYWFPKAGDAKTVEETIELTVNDLGHDERAILRRVSRTGFCPADLDAVRSGFQALCDKEVRGSPRADAIEEATRRVMERSDR